jgi:hypothetical protein
MMLRSQCGQQPQFRRGHGRRQVIRVCSFEPKRVAGVTSEVLVLGVYDAADRIVLAGLEHPIPNDALLHLMRLRRTYLSGRPLTTLVPPVVGLGAGVLITSHASQQALWDPARPRSSHWAFPQRHPVARTGDTSACVRRDTEGTP